MICNICGGSESYIQDGVAYCSECSEQIKGSIHEDSGEEYFSKSSLLSSPTSKKKRTKKSVSLAPWLMSDAYNLILCKQVSALIKLGCSEKLKPVVLSLWAWYLQKCQLAFGKNERFKPRLSVYPAKRDIELLYGEGLRSNLSEIYRPNYKSYKTKRRVIAERRKRKLAEKMSQTEPGDPVTSNSDLSGNESVSSASNSEVSSDESSASSLPNPERKRRQCKAKFSYSKEARKLMKRGYRRSKRPYAQERCPSHMTLTKTLSFCYLGLLYTEDQLSLFDLLRLVRRDVIPFNNVTRHFPSTMQLDSFDHTYFQLWQAPDIKIICSISARLMEFLQWPKYKEPSRLHLAIRFVKDLNLPCDLIPVLKLLSSKIDKIFAKRPKLRRTPYSIHKTIPSYEAQALSLVLVALKMLFVLDDKFEVDHSEIMKKFNSVSKEEKYFVWKEWQQQMSLKDFLFMKKYTTKNDAMSYLDMLSADMINGNYPVSSTNIKNEDLITNLSKGSKKAYTTRKELATLFEILTDETSIKKSLTSFPLRCELQYLMNNWKKLPLFKATENIDFSFIAQDFSHHKLYYRPSLTTDEPMNLLLASLYESVKFHLITEHEYYFEDIIRTTSKYWYAKLDYPDFKNRKWLNPFPSSFKWLLNLMSNYLQMDIIDFYRIFSHIEHILTKIKI